MLTPTELELYAEKQARQKYFEDLLEGEIAQRDTHSMPFGYYSSETFEALKMSKLRHRIIKSVGFITGLVLIGLMIYLYQLPSTIVQ